MRYELLLVITKNITTNKFVKEFQVLLPSSKHGWCGWAQQILHSESTIW